MATINYKCPNCGGPLKFNPDKQKFSCEYCMSDFDEKTIQDLYAEQEAKESRADREEQRAKEKAEKTSGQENTASEEDAVVYTCPSCGAPLQLPQQLVSIVRTLLFLVADCPENLNPTGLCRLHFQKIPQPKSLWKCAEKSGFCLRILRVKNSLINLTECTFRIGM